MQCPGGLTDEANQNGDFAATALVTTCTSDQGRFDLSGLGAASTDGTTSVFSVVWYSYAPKPDIPSAVLCP